MLEFIETAALCKNPEVSLAALKSFQEMLHMRDDVSGGNGGGGGQGKDEWRTMFENPYKPSAPNAAAATAVVAPPSVERMTRSGSDDAASKPGSDKKISPEVNDVDDAALWEHAWAVWLSIGDQATQPPPPSADVSSKSDIYIPSQTFLTALVRIFAPLYAHTSSRFAVTDLRRLCHVLQQALAVPVHSDSSPFILPVGDVALTSLQQAVLDAVNVLQSVSSATKRLLPSSLLLGLACVFN